MNTVLKHIVARTYKPLLVKYLSKTRRYRYAGIEMEIPPEVFHPGFFFSTQMLLQYIETLPLKGKQFLELGCGSGLISMVAAKKGATVCATDVNPVAIGWLEKNSRKNQVVLDSIHSDLFSKIPAKNFDIIAINPPYYKKDPVEHIDYAWNCGANGEYFINLFKTLGNFMHPGSEVLMVLFDGCDIQMISDHATSNGFLFNGIREKQNLLEKNFIYKISKVS